MSMFNEKVDNSEISVAASRGNLVKIRVVEDKKVSSILMTKARARQLAKAIIVIVDKIK